MRRGILIAAALVLPTALHAEAADLRLGVGTSPACAEDRPTPVITTEVVQEVFPAGMWADGHADPSQAQDQARSISPDLAQADAVASGTTPRVAGTTPRWEGGDRTGIVLQDDHSVRLDVHVGGGQCCPDPGFGGCRSEMATVTRKPHLGLALDIRF